MPQKKDSLKMDGSISTDDFKCVNMSDPHRHDQGSIGHAVVESDGARFVLVQKYTAEGIGYLEQVLATQLKGDEEIVAHESGANANAYRDPNKTVSGKLRQEALEEQEKQKESDNAR
jgi:hypothetical protein